MELIYRGRKYRSNNSIALKIIQERGYQVSHINQVTPVAIDRKFPLGQYVKQFFYEDIDTIYRPGKFWYEQKINYLDNCWRSSVTQQLVSCWVKTLVIERETAKPRLPIKYKYRGVTYYK